MSIEFKYMTNKLCLEGNVSKKSDGTNQVPTLKTFIVMSKFFLSLKKLLVSSKWISMTRGEQGNIKQNYSRQ